MSINPGNWSPPPKPTANRKYLAVVIPVVVVLAVALATGVGLLARNAFATEIRGTAVATPGASSAEHVLADGAVRIGDPHAKVTVRVVMDLQCPYCKMFEANNGSVLEGAVRDHTAAVEYSVITFLDRASTTQYSSRAGNASFCVANSGLEHYQSWLAAMFAQQPEEGSDGLTDDQLIRIAKTAGYAEDAVAQCIINRSYDTYLRAKTKAVLAGGVNSTPTVTVNGKQITSSSALMTPGGLAPLIAAG
ncbi:DsbA family protein [Nocardia jiangxiensis]|uniref:DsbA family protein n=1 Tax=Nocardia jiangxiensis TaxID=282685 RepID=A0ABW6SGI2_9NOCA|nr:thioredoxin domain-containing protein [Nocardia jiangxiensis]